MKVQLLFYSARSLQWPNRPTFYCRKLIRTSHTSVLELAFVHVSFGESQLFHYFLLHHFKTNNRTCLNKGLNDSHWQPNSDTWGSIWYTYEVPIDTHIQNSISHSITWQFPYMVWWWEAHCSWQFYSDALNAKDEEKKHLGLCFKILLYYKRMTGHIVLDLWSHGVNAESICLRCLRIVFNVSLRKAVYYVRISSLNMNMIQNADNVIYGLFITNVYCDITNGDRFSFWEMFSLEGRLPV